MKSIVFTGGGTGGHVFPGIAVAEALRGRIDETEYRIVWLGSSKGMEAEIVKRFHIPFYAVPAGKLRRYFSLKNFLDMGRVAAAYFTSLHLLRKLDTALLFSKGGFVSVPPSAAARSLRIPALTHESDLDPGLATRLNARFCEKVLCAYPQTARHPRLRAKALLTGNPVRREILTGDAAEGRRLLGASRKEKILLVLGGSQGARRINDLVEGCIDGLTDRAFVVHQMGSEHYRQRYGDVPWREVSGRRKGYVPAPIFSEEFPHILAAADLVVSRAGAGTLWENGVRGKAAVLIPLGRGSSRGDQLRNAAYFAEHEAAVLLFEEETNAVELLEKCSLLLEDDLLRERIGERAEELCPSNACDRIVDEILAFLNES